jgi:hypothetical protein
MKPRRHYLPCRIYLHPTSRVGNARAKELDQMRARALAQPSDINPMGYRETTSRAWCFKPTTPLAWLVGPSRLARHDVGHGGVWTSPNQQCNCDGLVAAHSTEDADATRPVTQTLCESRIGGEGSSKCQALGLIRARLTQTIEVYEWIRI